MGLTQVSIPSYPSGLTMLRQMGKGKVKGTGIIPTPQAVAIVRLYV